jgi:hypothetical protein
MTVYISALGGAGAQFFDSNGDPLSGGLLYTYAAGTTTPQTTYTSDTGLTTNANPIVLNSAGRTPEGVWLTQGAAYKFVLKTSLGVEIWTFDDIVGVNDVSAVAWSAISGTPTTLAGYGITDALSTAAAATTYAPIVSPAFTGAPTAADNGGTQQSIGWRDAPQNSQTVNYILTLADRGKSVLMNGTSLTLTIPANGVTAFPIGTVIIVVNINTTSLSIGITTDTLTLANSTTTGTRTLARNGVATLIKIAGTSWLASGTGLT